MAFSVIHVVPGVADQDGGPSYSVPRLAAAQKIISRSSVDVYAVGASAGYAQPGVRFFKQSFGDVPLLRKFRSSIGMKHALGASVSRGCVVHSHGMWLMPNVYAGRAARIMSSTLIVSPRGMLSQYGLSRKRMQKLAVWYGFQRPAVSRAHAWHATSDAEAREIRAFGINQPIAVIPNGVDLPICDNGSRLSKADRQVLYLSRLSPKKGVEKLLRSWACIAPSKPSWRLSIVGPDEGNYRQHLERVKASLGLRSVEFLGAQYGRERDQFLQAADLFVLPTENENFGLVVAEALSFGVPCIVTRGAPWEGLEVNKCGWWIDNSIEALARTLSDAMVLSDEERTKMGERGRRWVERDFSWSEIASKFLRFYEWCQTGRDQPEFIQLC